MITRLATSLRAKLPTRGVVHAYRKAALSRYPLPPGKLVQLDQLEKADRYFLLHQASQVGPIFKAQAWNQFWVCIVGLSRCRRFLQQHSASLRADTLDLDSLVPNGFLRKMEGPVHRKYRKQLMSGIQIHELFNDPSNLRDIAQCHLDRYAANKDTYTDPASAGNAYRETLNAIATGMLIQIFFGAIRDTSFYQDLVQGYRKLGPFGLVWNIGQKQREALAQLRSDIRRHQEHNSGGAPTGLPDSIFGNITRTCEIDDTLLGNLIYMVEMGRYDMSGLFRWLTKYSAEHPELLEQLTDKSDRARGKRAEAFVLETLRSDQSERLIRVALEDLVFDGYLIPRGTQLRLCLWESHHLAESFECPFDFKPSRFQETTPSSDEFSPFGLDHHRCPVGEVSIRAAMIFLTVLAENYRVQPLADGLPIRGAYHWEPSTQFSVRLDAR